MRNGDFFFNDTATTEIYTLSLHDALPISRRDLDPALGRGGPRARPPQRAAGGGGRAARAQPPPGPRGARVRRRHRVRSEEHTSELQSRQYLVCRLLLEKKNN